MVIKIHSAIACSIYNINMPQAPTDHDNLMSAKWGKLSCAILAQDWDAALDELNKLKRDIDETVSALARRDGSLCMQ